MEDLQTLLYVLIAFSGALFVFAVVVLALHRRGQEKDAFQDRLNKVAGRMKKGAILDDELEKPLTERLLKPISNKFLEGVRRVTPTAAAESDPTDSRAAKFKKQLRQAGMKIGVNEYRTIRILVMAALGLVFAFIIYTFSNSFVYAIAGLIFGPYCGYVFMRFQLSVKAKNRKKAMQRQLPEILDMISVSVEAGLGLEQAMIEVVSNFEGPLIDEFAIANREMAMGRSRSDALLLLGDRCDFDEMQTFTRAIVQATQMGIAVKNVLRSQSEYMRQTRKNKIEEKAMKISVKILLPMAGFILPVLFIILLGPAVISIIETFSK